MPVTIQTLYVQLLTALLLVATSCTDTTVQNQPALTSRTITTDQSQPALTLTIVPTSYPNSVFPEPIISLYKPFHVLLTNNSSAPVNIFEEWNSWGYYGLSFELTFSDGRQARATKAVRAWNANYPSTITIAPHGYYVFEVDFGAKWNNPIPAEPNAEQGIKCRMRAIYSINPTKGDVLVRLAGLEPVWFGTISSEESAYTIYP